MTTNAEEPTKILVQGKEGPIWVSEELAFAYQVRNAIDFLIKMMEEKEYLNHNTQ